MTDNSQAISSNVIDTLTAMPGWAGTEEEAEAAIAAVLAAVTRPTQATPSEGREALEGLCLACNEPLRIKANGSVDDLITCRCTTVSLEWINAALTSLQHSACVVPDEAATTLSFIAKAVSEYRNAPYRSADWLAMQVMDALDGSLTPSSSEGREPCDRFAGAGNVILKKAGAMCSCMEIHGEDPRCILHGEGTKWRKSNPDICELAEQAATLRALRPILEKSSLSTSDWQEVRSLLTPSFPEGRDNGGAV